MKKRELDLPEKEQLTNAKVRREFIIPPYSPRLYKISHLVKENFNTNSKTHFQKVDQYYFDFLLADNNTQIRESDNLIDHISGIIKRLKHYRQNIIDKKFSLEVLLKLNKYIKMVWFVSYIINQKDSYSPLPTKEVVEKYQTALETDEIFKLLKGFHIRLTSDTRIIPRFIYEIMIEKIDFYRTTLTSSIITFEDIYLHLKSELHKEVGTPDFLYAIYIFNLFRTFGRFRIEDNLVVELIGVNEEELNYSAFIYMDSHGELNFPYKIIESKEQEKEDESGYVTEDELFIPFESKEEEEKWSDRTKIRLPKENEHFMTTPNNMNLFHFFSSPPLTSTFVSKSRNTFKDRLKICKALTCFDDNCSCVRDEDESKLLLEIGPSIQSLIKEKKIPTFTTINTKINEAKMIGTDSSCSIYTYGDFSKELKETKTNPNLENIFLYKSYLSARISTNINKYIQKIYDFSPFDKEEKYFIYEDITMNGLMNMLSSERIISNYNFLNFIRENYSTIDYEETEIILENIVVPNPLPPILTHLYSVSSVNIENVKITFRLPTHLTLEIILNFFDSLNYHNIFFYDFTCNHAVEDSFGDPTSTEFKMHPEDLLQYTTTYSRYYGGTKKNKYIKKYTRRNNK